MNATRDDERRQHRGLSLRFGLTALDQCVSSASNFAAGVAVARVAGVAGLGAYSLAYALWLVVAAVHRSLVTDLMSIQNDLLKPDADSHVRVGLAAELWLGLVMAMVFAGAGLVLLATGNHQFGTCFLILAPFLPCLLAQDYWRWIGFMRARPGSALVNDTVFLVVQFSILAALLGSGIHSLALAIAAWALGAAAGAVLGLRQYRVRPTLRGGLRRIRSRWLLSRWLVGVDVISSARAQVTLMLTGAFLGPIGVGGLKAASSLASGPSMVLLQAGGSIGLPEAAKGLKDRGWPGLRRVQRLVTAAGMVSVGLVVVAIFCFGRQLLGAIYGPQFTRYANIADIVAVGIFAITLSLGAILCMKVTLQTSRLFGMNLVSLAISIIAIIALTPTLGVAGAAYAFSLGNLATSVTFLIPHFRSSRREAERLSRPMEDHSVPQLGQEVPVK